MKTIIVGGVAGGASAAARLRRLDEHHEIIMFERGEHISFANCGLPYYIGGVIEDREDLFVTSKEKMQNRFNIDVRNKSEVLRVDKESKLVFVKDLETGEEYSETYDKLILSPGANPIKPNFKGIEDQTVFTLRNIKDTDAIYGFIEEKSPKTVAVIGGGFIGVEVAENLIHKGLDVHLVDMANQVMAPFDFEMAQFLHEEMINEGVKLYLGEAVQSFNKTSVITDKSVIDADFVVMAIGVKGETTLAESAGLEINRNIVVNRNFQTTDKDIYAIGDAIEVKNFITKNATIIPLAWPANRMGRLVADHIMGKQIHYPGTLGTSVAKIFNLTAASTGLNEKNIEGEYNTLYVNKNNHAGYYPGADEIDLKVIYNPTTKEILGAQAIGKDGVEKRIDVIATAIRFGAKVDELAEIEVAYAPPYNSAKDLVNIAGYIADNQLNGYEFINWNQISDEFLLDVRTEEEFLSGHVEGSVNYDVDYLRNHIDMIPKDKEVVIACQVGQRAHVAASMLKAHGFNVKNLNGGYNIYKQANYKW